MRKRILFYSNVVEKKMFHIQRFYQIDINLLEELGYSVMLSNRIRDFFHFRAYDIAFLYFYRYSFFSALIARLSGKKVYFTGGIDALDHKINTLQYYWLQRIFFKLCRLVANKCILVSNSDIENIKKIYRGNLPSKMYFSPHTIDVDRFCVDGCISKKQDMFLSIVWMIHKENVIRKGVDKALYLFEYLTHKPEFKNARLYIVGSKGEGTVYLQDICAKLNIVDRVIFTGDISEEEKIYLLKMNKYYFQLSKYEGFGIAALEALTAKNIVIHSGKGGLKDTVKDYGIKVDIDKELPELFERVYDEMLSFSNEKLLEAESYVMQHYSNEQRKKAFDKVLTGKV